MRKKPKQASKGRSREENAIKKRKKCCGFVRAELGFPFENFGLTGGGKALIERITRKIHKFLASLWLRGESLFMNESN